MTETLSHDYTMPFEQRLRELEIANAVRSKNKFKVLDVCCRRFPRGFGVDLHPESNADLICDAHNLGPLADKSFDLTMCIEGIEHLLNPALAVKEWVRVTRYALCVTTQNAHCWRRWLKLPFLHNCTSPDHIYLWGEYAFYNFFRKLLPQAKISLIWYDRYLKKTRFLKPAKLFHENIAAFVWLADYNLPVYSEVRAEALRLINSRPEQHPLWMDRGEYSDRKTNICDCKGIGIE